MFWLDQWPVKYVHSKSSEYSLHKKEILVQVEVNVKS